MTEYPLLRARGDDAPIAMGPGGPVSAGNFLADIAALAARLPRRGQMINLCRHRYRFAVGFAAALCRQQFNLLPPNDASATLAQIALDYPGSYCLTDSESPAGLDALQFPADLPHDAEPQAVPCFAADQPAAVLFTSGSTGRPQPHVRSWGDLVISALAAGRRFAIESLGSASLLGTVPHQHSYGLESLLMLALQHGLVLHGGRPFYPADVVAELRTARRPVTLVTTPLHLRVLLAHPDDLPRVDLLLCATAPLSNELARAAEARFAVALHEIYGCSEAGQIATRRTAMTDEWHCLDGIVLRQDTAGTWASGTPIASETLLSDAIELHDQQHFLLHGRIADVVNVAGKRSSLAYLNHHINAIEGVRDAAFFAPDGDGVAVSRLVAFAVAPDLTAEHIRAALRKRIDAAFMPRPLLLVDALPRNALGKLPRETVLRMLTEHTQDSLQDT